MKLTLEETARDFADLAPVYGRSLCRDDRAATVERSVNAVPVPC